MSRLVLIVLVSLSSASAWQCPAPSGLFPSPDSCTQFYMCSDGQPHLASCPPGLQYNRAGYCDWPYNVHCQDTTVGFHTTTARTTTPSTWSEWPSTKTTTASTWSDSTTPPLTSSYPDSTSHSSDSSCRYEAEEPISEDVRESRSMTCRLAASAVEKIWAGSKENPDNVKILEEIISPQKFKELFPKANPAYTYENFLKAVGSFPAVCRSRRGCRRELANMFAHFQQETLGLHFLEEIKRAEYCAQWTVWVSESYPCSPGRKYYGRGAKQLSWNYNYGAFSQAMFGDPQVLLHHPDLVATTWLNFASAIWFFVTPQPPKPSMLQVVSEEWRPNGADVSGNILPGFGATTMIINGALECGPSPANTHGSNNRQHHYRLYAEMFGLDITGEKLDCADMSQFSSAGSANLALYWEPGQACSLVTWQTAFSALVDDNYQRCLEASP